MPEDCIGVHVRLPNLGCSGCAHADWVQHHADLGVAGIHMYATAAEHALPTAHGGGLMQQHGIHHWARGLEHHRLLHWKLVRGGASRGDEPIQHMQQLVHDDCGFRWRHAYTYLAFLDDIEFLHFPGQAPHQACSALLCSHAAAPHLIRLRHACEG